MALDLVLKENIILLVVPGAFNATISVGVSVESITSQFGLPQIINEHTHILENLSLCIDLIFTLESNLSVEQETKPSLLHNYHHHIIYIKFNLEVSYPSSMRFDTLKNWSYQTVY